MKRKIITIGIAILVFVLALFITLYPVISNYYNERHQSEIHTQYMEVIEQVDNSDLIQAKELADEYNAAIVPGTQLAEAFSQQNGAMAEAVDASEYIYDPNGVQIFP